jgi:hypothetical protein
MVTAVYQEFFKPEVLAIDQSLDRLKTRRIFLSRVDDKD